jgi:hypothetical protein
MMPKHPLGFMSVMVLLSVAGSAQQSVQFFSRTASKTTNPAMADIHFQSTPAAALFYNSAFAHGYRHGYEQGFHVGDLDVQMGRNPQQVEKTTEFRHDVEGFKNGFGDKNSFRNGYRRGFRVAYREALAGLPFRGSLRTETAANGLSDFLQNEERTWFDYGFSGGYLTASGLSHPSPVTVDYAEQYCQKTKAAEQQHASAYCSGYSRGYLLGESDSSIASGLPEASVQTKK